MIVGKPSPARPGRAWSLAAALGLAAALALGCSSASRYRVLSFFFDGVPPPERPAPSAPVEGTPISAARQIGSYEHGPFAAKACHACHQPGAMNALVAPRDELCLRCHDLALAKRYVHGPLAAGGCMVCHDPHRSAYRYLLVSESDGFCLTCHQRDSLRPIAGHVGDEANCTACHEAHMSDQPYLLR